MNSRANKSIIETKQERLCRKSMNAVMRCQGYAQKSSRAAKIHYQKSELEQHKKRFGVEYMNLMERGASPAALESCIKEAWARVRFLREDIDALEAEVASIDSFTQTKLIQKPGKQQQQKEQANRNGDGGSSSAPDNSSSPAAAATPPTEPSAAIRVPTNDTPVAVATPVDVSPSAPPEVDLWRE